MHVESYEELGVLVLIKMKGFRLNLDIGGSTELGLEATSDHSCYKATDWVLNT